MSAMKRKTNVDVLVVEDDDFLGRALQAKFDLEGIPVRIARDGDIALAEVRRKPPALILLDIMLPTGSGLDLLVTLRAEKQFKDLPILVVSNLGQQEDIQSAKEKGANDYFVKADTPIGNIVEAVRQYLK